MEYNVKRQLRVLGNKQIAEDVKKYIKSSYDFYGTKVPEFKVLAKRLHEEYSLKEFYRIFNKFWKLGYHDKMSLAIYTLQLYKEQFDMETWKFIKPKLKEMKSWDSVDSVGANIIGQILLKYPKLEKEIIILAKSNNKWTRRMAVVSTFPLIEQGNIILTMKISEILLHEKEERVQRAVGRALNFSGNKKPDIVRKFILKNINMPHLMFEYATTDMKGLRKLREDKKGRNNSIVRNVKKIFGR